MSNAPETVRQITIDEIVQAVTRYFEIDVQELKSVRNRRAVRARHMTWWLCRQLTARTLPQIAIKLGAGTDGVTAVLSGVHRIDKGKETNGQLAADLDALVKLLKK